MAENERPFVYLILGATGSGRRAVLIDLIGAGLDDTDRAAVLLPAAEAENETDRKLPAISRWEWQDGTIVATLPAEATHVFFVVDGFRNPIDQLEVFKAWLDAQGGELARV